MAKLSKIHAGAVYVKPRGWGHEEWIENLPEYCGKLLVIDPGKRGSLHFHMKKLETMYVIQGVLHLKLIDPETAEEYFEELLEGDSIRIPRGQVHQITNPNQRKHLKLIEFSTTHEEEDSRRVQKGD